MIERVNLQPITLEGHNRESRQKIGRRVQELVRDDFLRVGANPIGVGSFVDPDNERMVELQIERITLAAERGQLYGGIYTDEVEDELQGVVKVGQWRTGDAKPFGPSEVEHVRMEERYAHPEDRARGLHVFSVEQELILPSLRAIRDDARFLSPTAPLKAAVHAKDDYLADALAELGAEKGPAGVVIKLGSYAAQYTLWTLPPKDGE